MAVNPYEPPQTTDAPLNAYRVPVALQIPAVALLGLGSLSSLGLVTLPILLVLSIVTRESPRFTWMDGGVTLGSILAPLVTYGAFQMRRLRRYRFCCLAAALACVPLISPMIWMGIPFGIWALIVLRRPSVRELFSE